MIFKQKRQIKWKAVQETIDDSCILQIIIILIDVAIVLAVLISLEWLLFTCCTLNIYVKLVFSLMVVITIPEIDIQVMKHYFPKLGAKKNPLYKGDETLNK